MVEALPSGAQAQANDANYGHDCEGARCVCQRYENGELAVVVMGRMHNRNRQNPEFVDIVQENIYERLDNEEEEVRVDRNDANGDHTYERIDNLPWYRGNGRANNAANFQGSVFWNANRYDNSRDIYLGNHGCLNRLSGLSRNCFSTDNVALATHGRYIYHLGQNCVCQFCTRLPFARYHMCQHCNSFHDRLRCYEPNPTGPLAGSSRNYIYQVSHSCRGSYCRGEYARLPISRLVDSLRRDCQCRNTGNCHCRSRLLSSSNSAIYIGRIGRIPFAQGVNNPLYSNPAIYVGRIDRAASNQDGAAASGEANNEAAASAENVGAEARNLNQAGPSNGSVCPVNNTGDRPHTCDDSCIRNHPANLSGLCQFVSRAERPECHGRVSYHWWFVNRWLPNWGSQNERNTEPVPRVEEPRDPPGDDSDEI